MRKNSDRATVAALYEGGNELEDRVFPSWNRRGGRAGKKKARSLRSGADGVVIMVNVEVGTLSRTDHPVCAFIRRLRSIFLMAQPPLLSEEGNTLSCNSFTPSMTAATAEGWPK